jgi:hypothetical protein
MSHQRTRALRLRVGDGFANACVFHTIPPARATATSSSSVFVPLRPRSLSIRSLFLAARSLESSSLERPRRRPARRRVSTPTSRERPLLHRHEHERGKHDPPRAPDADRGRARGRRVVASSPCAALESNETVGSSWSGGTRVTIYHTLCKIALSKNLCVFHDARPGADGATLRRGPRGRRRARWRRAGDGRR